jgi:hypothetical protein
MTAKSPGGAGGRNAPRKHRPEAVGNAGIWIAAAVSSGVLGNAATDLLKGVAARYRSKSGTKGQVGYADAVVLAALAIEADCAKRGRPTEIDTFRHSLTARCQPSGTWEVVALADGFFATVTIPPGSPADVQVAVATFEGHPGDLHEFPAKSSGATERLSLNLARDFAQVLRQLMKRLDISAPEAIRRAISVLKFITDEQAAGRRLAVIETKDGKEQVREVIFHLGP